MLFVRLAVFAGGWTLDAAEAVCGEDGLDVFETLASLVDESLVRPLRRPTGEPRFAMLETIREYAAELLDASGEAEGLHRRHCEYVLAEVEPAAAAFASNADPGDAFLGLLDQEHDNLRAALTWAAETDELDLEVRLAAAARWFWVIRGFLSEGRRYFDGIFARTVAAPKPLRALALAHGATLPYRQGDTALAKQLWEEALDLYRELGDAEGAARIIGELGAIAVAESDFDRGVAMYEECAEMFREQGRTTRLAIALGNLGAIANMRGDRETAVSHLTEAIALTREIGDDDSLAINLHNIARAEIALGRLDEGRTALSESIGLARRLGYREVLAYCLGGLAELALLEDDATRAATMLGASEHLFHEIGAALDPEEVESQDRIAAFVQERLGPAQTEELRGAAAAAELDELLEGVASQT